MNRKYYSHRDVARYAKICPILFPIVIALSYVLYTHFDMKGNFSLLVLWIGCMTIIGTFLPVYLSCRRKKKLTVSNKRLFGMETRVYYKQYGNNIELEDSDFDEVPLEDPEFDNYIHVESFCERLIDDAETKLSPVIPKYQEEYDSEEFKILMTKSPDNIKIVRKIIK